MLQPGERACLKATVKLSWNPPGPYVVVEADPTEKEVGLELVPEIIPFRALFWSVGRVSVSVWNVTSYAIRLKPWMLIRKVTTATWVEKNETAQMGDGKGPTTHCPSLPPAWERKIKDQIGGKGYS